ncbi:MAG TPA: hypothetical protein VKG84_00685 [Candidatus Acidoferrales bacterium]|nr:hypothetical protein [Candidatus Acidoferrales bacterium]
MKAHAAVIWRTIPLVLSLLLAALVVAGGLPAARAQAPSAHDAVKDQKYTVEYYYKASWGHADEWLRLFKKNHLPLLKALQSQGRIVELEMEKPRYHTTEDGRWDYRVTITWKNFGASQDPGTEQATIRKLYPDQETYQREEQRRFEILIAHWDLPIMDVATEP